ncbi:MULTISPECIES: glutathione synthase [Aphanothece]|uniref:glutathione synthase n=1 Tax=Aphanothece TaxID=1121 RepID=UPI00398557BA
MSLSSQGFAPGERAQLFVIDPITRLNPAKDSSVALMQAAQRAGHPVWVATPADLSAREGGPGAQGQGGTEGHGAWVLAQPVRLAPMEALTDGWSVPTPWFELGEARQLPLVAFAHVWMRKDPPVDEAYLYATHLLDLAERQGVRVLNRPASLRAWNEKLSALRWSHLMAPTLVASRVDQLATFTAQHGEVVLKPLGGRAGQGVVFAAAATPGLRALLELVTALETLPVMVQAFLPGVKAGDKRILLVDGEPLGAVNRIPSGGEFRSNLAVGGAPQATELTDQERRICRELAPALRDEGLFFVGIDVIDGRLSEINVTSPTGIREVERLGGIPLADLTLERLAQG